VRRIGYIVVWLLFPVVAVVGWLIDQDGPDPPVAGRRFETTTTSVGEGPTEPLGRTDSRPAGPASAVAACDDALRSPPPDFDMSLTTVAATTTTLSSLKTFLEGKAGSTVWHAENVLRNLPPDGDYAVCYFDGSVRNTAGRPDVQPTTGRFVWAVRPGVVVGLATGTAEALPTNELVR
jgi:hypothetical protein